MQIRRPRTGGLSFETSGASSSAGSIFLATPSGPRALVGPPSKASLRRKRNACLCAGSPECLLNAQIRSQPADRAIEPCARRRDRAAGDSRHVLQRHVQVEVEDDHEPVLMAEPCHCAAQVGAADRAFLARNYSQVLGQTKTYIGRPLAPACVAAFVGDDAEKPRPDSISVFNAAELSPRSE